MAPFDAQEGPPEQEAAQKEQAILAAINFWQAALANGPRKSKEVEAEGRAAGHALRTLDYARQRLHTVAIKVGKGTAGYWLIALPSDLAAKEYLSRHKNKQPAGK